MKLNQLVPVFAATLFLFSCVSTKKYRTIETQFVEVQSQNKQLQSDLNTCNTDKAALQSQKSGLETDIANLNRQIDFLRQNNTQALKQLEDLSVITSTQAESIKKSLQNIGVKDTYIQTLQQQMARNDS